MARRVFWMGMHKVLKPTELRRLRALGVEVFNPAYFSPVYDQSADRTVDRDQPTTLPRDVFDKFLSYNFFYNDISSEIAELLNTYFDTAVITITAHWLKPFLKAFKGQIIYRVYGQHFSLSEQLIEFGLWESMITRERLSVVPFAAESVEREHRWFLDLCSHIVPYQLPDDVFEHSGAWEQTPHRQEIATSIPNIENAYYEAAYSAFNSRFPQTLFRIYGPQRSTPPDPRIVGALERRALLRSFAEASGFLYDYRDQVCYLSPIEMMELGGPVLFAPGSLLSRFAADDAPGRYEDVTDAEVKCGRLLAGDQVFIDEIKAAQESVRQRYDRVIVGPLFDQAFSELLLGAPLERARIRRDGPLLVSEFAESRARPAVLLPLHADGLFGHENGRAYAFEGIPRVMDAVIDSAIEQAGADVIVSCTGRSAPVVGDFFERHLKSGRVSLYIVANGEGDDFELNRLELVRWANGQDLRSVLIPHYYLFPEFLLYEGVSAIYLPDYFPHLMPEHVFDVSREKDAENKAVGVALTKRASAVLMLSNYTKSYLTDAGFVGAGELEKVAVAPLPLLGAGRAAALTGEEERELAGKLAGRTFLFYPTANRPNKNIDFCLRVFAVLRERRPGLALVLTCSLGTHAPAAEAAHRYEVMDDLVFVPRASEGALRWLYEHSIALCLTSSLEGNFPPQILEALTYGAPIVSSRMPVITEVLRELSDGILLCRPRDLETFVDGLETVIDRRAEVLDRQAQVLAQLRKWNSPAAFAETVARALRISGDAEKVEQCASA